MLDGCTSRFTDHTHDPQLRSWVESANDPRSDFPIQNLPFGVFRRTDSAPDQSSSDTGGAAHIGVAIGDHVLDLTAAIEHGAVAVDSGIAGDFFSGSLNSFMARGREAWRTVRRAVSAFLVDPKGGVVGDPHAGTRGREGVKKWDGERGGLLVLQSQAKMLLPAVIGDYTDFYASIHHAKNVGSMLRPDNPLLPNYRHLPVGYHGRASTIVPSGTPIRRPMGQTKPADAPTPIFGPSRMLDYEVELGAFTGPGNPMGTRLSPATAMERLFGLCIVNDWSARDVQSWEYQPLGPFNAKNFATTISPWVVTLEALAPFRIDPHARGGDDPPVLEYLLAPDGGGLDIIVEVWLSSRAMRKQGRQPSRVSRAPFASMYWTLAQMLAHHTSTGCAMRPGDLIASGTISGPEEDSRGCLLERTWRGQQPITLPDGTQRAFLQDGDEVIMRAFCEHAAGGGVARRIGFGECRGVVLEAQ